MHGRAARQRNHPGRALEPIADAISLTLSLPAFACGVAVGTHWYLSGLPAPDVPHRRLGTGSGSRPDGQLRSGAVDGALAVRQTSPAAGRGVLTGARPKPAECQGGAAILILRRTLCVAAAPTGELG